MQQDEQRLHALVLGAGYAGGGVDARAEQPVHRLCGQLLGALGGRAKQPQGCPPLRQWVGSIVDGPLRRRPRTAEPPRRRGRDLGEPRRAAVDQP